VGGSGDWDTASNWSTGNIPTAADDVSINVTGISITHVQGYNDAVHTLTSSDPINLSNGGIYLAGNSSISAALTMMGGTLDGPGNLTIGGLLTWSGGEMRGTGSTTASGGVTFNGTNSNETLTGRTFNLAGPGTWTGLNNIYMGYGAVFNIKAGVTFAIQNSQSINASGGASAAINNAGTVTLSQATPGTSIFQQGPFVNNGTVTVNTGTLELNAGGSSAGGFGVAAGATLDLFNGVYRLETGTTITQSGAGSGSSVVIDGNANVSVDAPLTLGTTNLTMNSGTLTGSATLTVNNQLTWNGGTMSGNGSTTIAASTGILSLSGTNTQETLDTRTLSLGGTGSWSGTNNLVMLNSSKFNVLSGATFTIANDQNVYYGGAGGSPTISNAGTVTKSGTTGTTNIQQGAFNNSGTVNVSTGTLQLSAGGNMSGSFAVASGSTLQFGGGLVNLNNGTTITQSGAGSASSLGISGGIVSVNTALTIGTSQVGLTGGVLTGAAPLTVTSQLTWSGGNMTGTGSTTIVAKTGVLNVNSTNALLLDTRTLNLAGTGTWSGTGNNFFMDDGSVFNVKAGATFTIANDQNVFYSGVGATPVINNAGTIVKSGTTGTTEFTQGPFNNAGNVMISSGTLEVAAGGNMSGRFQVAPSATLQFTYGIVNFNAGASILQLGIGSGSAVDFSGFGTYAVNADLTIGTTTVAFSGGTFAGPANLTIVHQFQWSGGNLSLLGTTTVQSLQINTATSNLGLGYGTLALIGGGTWTGAGNNFYMFTGSTFNIESTAKFSIQTDQNIFYGGGSSSTINNAGVFSKAVTTGTTTITQGQFNNSGTVNVLSGTLDLNSGGSSSGAWNVTSKSSLAFLGGTWNFATGTAILQTGAGTGSALVFNGSSIYATASTLTLGTTTVAFQSGNWLGTCNVTITNTLNWSGGTFGGFGTLTIAATTGHLNFTGTSASETLDAATIVNNGTALWSGTSNINLGDGAVITNAASAKFTIACDQSFNGFGVTETFNNAGTLTKATTSGETTSPNVTFNNTGVVKVTSGQLDMGNGGTSTGSWTIADTAILSFSNGIDKLNAGTTVTGSGSGELLIDGATVNVNSNVVIATGFMAFTNGLIQGVGALTINGQLNWSGGTIAGSGSTTIAKTGSLLLDGVSTPQTTAVEELDGSTLNLLGNATWSATNNFELADSATVNNQAGATFTIFCDQIIIASGSSSTFNNAGTLTKVSTPGVTTLPGAFFNNMGTVNVTDGTLDLPTGGLSSGAWNVSSGATLSFSGGVYIFNTGTTIGGAGAMIMSRGTASFNLNMTVATASVTLSGGTLAGNGALAIASQMNWSGGTITGVGSTTIAKTGSLTIAGPVTLDGRTLNLAGPTTWSATSDMSVNDGAVINNQAGAIFTVNCNQAINDGGGVLSVFNNAGILTKSDATLTRLPGVTFNNSGTVNVTLGTLEVPTGGTGSGAWVVSASAELLFSGGVYVFNKGTTMGGAGEMVISNGTTLFQAAITIGTSLVALTGNNGTLGGSGALTITNQFTWNAGTMNGSGSTTSAATTGIVVIAGAVNLNGRTLNLGGTTTWMGGNDLAVRDRAIINNKAGATFTIENDQNIVDASGNTAIFNNAGTLIKSTTTGVTSYTGAVFNNTGTVDVQTGTLDLDAGGTSSGTFTAESGATLSFNGNPVNNNSIDNLNFASTVVTGAGTVLFANGTIDLGGKFAVTGATNVTGGTVEFLANASTGTFSNTGGTVIIAASTSFTVVTGNYTQTAGNTYLHGGTITAQSVNIAQGSTLSALGQISGSLSIDGNLYLSSSAQGNNVGTLTVTGSYTQTANGTLNIAIGGPAAGTQYAQLLVDGSATLAGTVNVHTINGYAPTTGTTFGFLAYASVAGDFSIKNLGGIPSITEGGTGYTATA
jgi:hypothetical protein